MWVNLNQFSHNLCEDGNLITKVSWEAINHNYYFKKTPLFRINNEKVFIWYSNIVACWTEQTGTTTQDRKKNFLTFSIIIYITNTTRLSCTLYIVRCTVQDIFLNYLSYIYWIEQRLVFFMHIFAQMTRKKDTNLQIQFVHPFFSPCLIFPLKGDSVYSVHRRLYKV